MFRTELNIIPSGEKLSLKQPILTIGSCFSDNIGSKLKEYKFQTLANPFGTVYNPVSIFKLLSMASENNEPAKESYLTNDGIYANYDFHSSFSSLNQQELEDQVVNSLSNTHLFLDKSPVLIITFGTAFIYRRIDNDEIVANCHKVPAKNFKKELLNQKQIIQEFEQLHTKLVLKYPKIRFILTVSPVRHIKDSLELNSVSKSILRIACHSLSEQFENVEYFPSYEIQLDDLRDYRFYKSDMIHPTEEATHYIWNKFAECYFDESTLEFIEEWIKIKRAIDHKPFNPKSEKHQEFVRNTIAKIKSLNSDIDFTEELLSLKKALI
ncbi:MAG: GSCFA domain-containing protein [Fulvivirga sp.]|uniref:GSCFA domain-containing protein n=1 Tax=Fulvivirga sp. TaxID=1931237 RepID=UPI0032EF1446